MLLKNEILAILESCKGEPISGQMIAKQLSVSRAAIWKGVQALREDGHKIEAATNKGYRLAPESDLLSSKGIQHYLSSENKELNIRVFPIVDSTNLEAKRQAIDGASHGTTILAEEQTKGRGRLGRDFVSPKGGGLYMSMIFRMSSTFENATLFTIGAAVSVCRGISKLTDQAPEIKWVNDIFFKKKKICGILTEAVSNFETGLVENVIVGIGINVRTDITDFPHEVQKVVGTLADISAGLSRNQLAAEVINEMMKISQLLCHEKNDEQLKELIKEYKKFSLVLGKDISYVQNGETFNATAIDINDRGNLVVRDSEGTISVLQSGEVSIGSDSIYRR